MRLIIISILLSLILFTKCAVGYNPVGRTDMEALIISNKIYFYGGWNLSVLNDIFYIDLSNSFQATNPPFTLQANLKQRGGYKAVVNGNMIIALGGYDQIGNTNNLLIIDETTSNPYVTILTNSSNVTNANSWPSPRKWMTAVIDSNKTKMYVWGGTSSAALSYLNTDGTMYILDLKNYFWVANKSPTQPMGRQFHTATLVPDGRIIMIGGAFNPNMSQVDIYDTISGLWSQKTTLNGSTSGRWSHTATLATDGKSIIVFGGVSNNTNMIVGISILNLTNFTWTTVFPSGNPPAQYPNSHAATLYNDYIFFTFGIIGTNLINTVSILNISNNQYKWVDSYIPSGQSCTIEGGDIVGPKIRVAIYAQCLLIAFKIFVKKQRKIALSAFCGLVTSSVLIVAAIIQHINNDLHYVFQLEKLIVAIELLAMLVGLLITCYSIWLWTTIKWNLAHQECSSAVRMFFFVIPLDPTGWWRDFMLALFRSIVSSEIFLQRNPVSGISGGWGFKELVIAIMSGGDTITTITALFESPKLRVLEIKFLKTLHGDIEKEFSELWKPNLLSFEFNIESIIKDFILLVFFTSNDLIPPLSDVKINNNGLDAVILIYKEMLKECDKKFIEY
ncbi:9005_t:CDS:2 [Cetraspora pellucida]|uniref:9005_t:CDS:1 n=1 Tax=Cetraspora pellucida TaxID=1433469 RepID=A0A9N9NLP7_9GLOM|nr:9005_t:CDS:2 [Cetraspora pellucida]